MFQNGEIEKVMQMFENPSQQRHLPYTGGTLEHEHRDYWKKGRFYTNGNTNNQFKAFLAGYAFGKADARLDAA